MISPAFYNMKNLVEQFLGGKVAHYPVKDPSVTLEWYEHIVMAGETIYTLAEDVFGTGRAYLWTYIADNNPPRHPDDWAPGDIIFLPRVILRDSELKQG
jgi:hypothetical protein